MEELIEYRKQLLGRLPEAVREFRSACLAVKNPFTPIDAGWNVHQLAAHTRDVDKMIYGMRARRTLQEDNPEFQNFDAKQSLSSILNELVASIDELTEMLRGLSGAEWSRESRHATQGGGLTLQTWVERSLKHIEEHLATVKKVK